MNVKDDDRDELEALETLSLTDFPLSVKEDNHSGSEDYQNRNSSLTLREMCYSGSEIYQNRNIPPSPATEDLFEFCSGRINGFPATEDLFEFCSGRIEGFPDQHRMSHAEDMISGGKLIPINDQQIQTRSKKHIHRRRSESMHELKSTTNKGAARQLVRNSYSLDYKKYNKNSRLTNEPTAEIGHRSNLSAKTFSSRWSDLVFGPLKVPPEMDLRDIRNRQIVNNSKSLFPADESSNRLLVSKVNCHRKTSWGVLGILSCKSSGSIAVNMPLSYDKLSLKN
ncbi:hypothetical protein SSX86_021349 [Deinandra increscens subsp. villosa]|uniref:Uncharacterized protein n=1 Tax=Deinandra increscens subsp. villosa TaxID=3103831 RepID=A0AAP0GRL6_9ASTR